jgi:hypothetical protein
MEAVEDVIVDWLLRNAFLSNVEFAHFSNISKQWRQASKMAILKQLSEPYGTDERLSLLLLPSMVRFIMASYTQKAESGSHLRDQNATGNCDTFCAAWFHPDGVQELPISLNSNHTILSASDDDHSHTTSKSGPAYTLNGEATYDNSDKDDDTKDDTRSSRSSRKQQIRQKQNRSKSPATLSMSLSQRNHIYQNGTNHSTSTNEPHVPTCTEWRGYRTAIDILVHFGYANAFVNDVINTVRSKYDSSATQGTNVIPDIPHSNHRNTSPMKNKMYRDTTYAVRGAIVARPESYCDCIDTDIEKLRTLRFATAGNDELNTIRIMEYKQAILRKEIRRLELQRDVLPRIITRLVPATKNGSSVHSRENGANRFPLLPNTQKPQQQQQHRCVQFLNANGGHAVCMLTPPFACGPLIEPVTIFCIGIATEDGCFLSGLHRRFELGHLYPNSEIAEIAEQSPVCISTECGGARTGPEKAIQQKNFDNNIYNTEPITYPIIQTCEDDDDDRDGDEDDDDDDDNDNKVPQMNIVLRDNDNDQDSSDDGYSDNEPPYKCSCIFHGVGEKVAALDEGTPRIIHRGLLGPGMWHCYVAVFDGENSMIRIDGVSELIETENPNIEMDTSDNTKAMLDGLTIGSDHCFGMSLCCGNGSGGEGEGAIAELAVFKGRLDLTDIQVLEKELMERHCIPSIVLPPEELTVNNVHSQKGRKAGDGDDSLSIPLWKENQFARQAHALFFLPETEDGSTTLPSSTPLRIPLRFLSSHRSVAWKQTNPVTGEPIHIKRIGCKPGASSSDL